MPKDEIRPKGMNDTRKGVHDGVNENKKDADRIENESNGDFIPTAEHANEVKKDAGVVVEEVETK